MMDQSKRLSLDWTRVQDVSPVESNMAEQFKKIEQAGQALTAGSGPGADFTGWLELTTQDLDALVEPALSLAEQIANQSDAVVVIGIGGSNLGAKAVYDALTHSYAETQKTGSRSANPRLFWAGNHLATDEAVELLDALDAYTPSLIVISKSGTTTEPALGFRILKNYMDSRFGKLESSARIFAVTDPGKGTLRKLAQENDWPALEVPPSVGGRYSVFTACGLLPLASAGIDIRSFVEGARDAGQDSLNKKNASLETNPAFCYAAVRNALYSQGFKIESLCTWTPKLITVSEWWKQLFGESDAKGQTGLFPASVSFTTDLHSLGQYFQEGERHLFATHLTVQQEASVVPGGISRETRIPSAPELEDTFEFLSGERLSSIQHHAQNGTFLAHADGKCPTMVWSLPEKSAYWLGAWMYTNMLSCALGGYARQINPFDQPGVEAYKKNMFALIGKPGSDAQRSEIEDRIKRSGRLKSFGATR